MNLKGNSGCELIKNDNIVVKKAIGKYVPRLKAQMMKQKQFIQFNVNGYTISAEPILSYSEEKDSFSFTMPFDEGVTVASLIKNSNDTAALGETIIQFLNGMISKNEKVENAKELIDNKLKSLENTVPQEYVKHIKMFEQSLALLIYDLPAGYCHGDFTLENILIDNKNKNIHLIDFLDSFIESPLLDFATVLQDAKCLWSYRYETLSEKQKENINSFEKIIEDSIKDLGYYKQVEILLLMKLYRILPYIKDDTTKDFLNVNIKNIERDLKCW